MEGENRDDAQKARQSIYKSVWNAMHSKREEKETIGGHRDHEVENLLNKGRDTPFCSISKPCPTDASR